MWTPQWCDRVGRADNIPGRDRLRHELAGSFGGGPRPPLVHQDVVVPIETRTKGLPVAHEALSAHEPPQIPRGNLMAYCRARCQHRHRTKADRLGQCGEVREHQLVLEHVGLRALGHAARGRGVPSTGLGHCHATVRPEEPIHLLQYPALIRDVMERVTEDDPFTDRIVKRDGMTVVRNELRIKRPVRPWVALE